MASTTLEHHWSARMLALPTLDWVVHRGQEPPEVLDVVIRSSKSRTPPSVSLAAASDIVRATEVLAAAAIIASDFRRQPSAAFTTVWRQLGPAHADSETGDRVGADTAS